jgi:hypothetical protein
MEVKDAVDGDADHAVDIFIQRRRAPVIIYS